jgi:hypothetical protein
MLMLLPCLWWCFAASSVSTPTRLKIAELRNGGIGLRAFGSSRHMVSWISSFLFFFGAPRGTRIPLRTYYEARKGMCGNEPRLFAL